MPGINRNKLRGLRAEKNLTQEQVAEKLNITRVTYNAKEKGKTEFTEIEIAKLTKIFKVKRNVFFTK